MDGARVDPAAMASDKDHLPSACVMPGMPESAVPGLDDGSRTEQMASEVAAAVAEGLSKELSALDPSLAVLMQSGTPAPASRALSPPPPPDVPGAMMHGLLPPGAEGLLGGMGVPPPAAGGMLGALTAVPAGVVAGAVGSVSAAAALSKVGDLGGGIKDDKTPALDAAGKALKEQKKRLRPDGKEEMEKDGKKPKEGEEDMMAHKLCPHNKPKATCMECTGCPHGKRRQNCKDCNAGSRQWCQHGKRRHDCHECSGCPHGRIKRSCKDCSGSGICNHGKLKRSCRCCSCCCNSSIRGCCFGRLGKLKRSCRECSTDMCEHKRRRYYCRDCQGAGACEHNNRRWRCRECNGAYTCEHGLIKTNCLQCEMEKAAPKTLDATPPPPLEQGGDVQMGVPVGVPPLVLPLGPSALSLGVPLGPSAAMGLPVEGKEGDGAVDGGGGSHAGSAQVDAASLVPPAASEGSAASGVGELEGEEDASNLSRVCIHKRWRVFCAECGGNGLCEHGKRKGTCKTCGGSQFCEHKRLRRQCRICRPELKAQKVSLCPHNKRKARCRECGGSQFCEHGKNKDWCKDCGGRRLCEHQRQKHQCRECCALNICPHKRPDQCVGKSGKERGRPRIHAEKPKVPGARRGRPPKAQNIMGKDLVAAPPMVAGVDPKVLAGVKDHVPEPAAPAGSMSVPAAPPPPPSDMPALLPAAAAWAVGGLAAGAGAGAASGMGVKEVPTMGIKEVPTGLMGGALGGVKKDKASRLIKKGKKGGGEAEEQAAEPLLGGEDVDPLYALSVHAVSASAKEKAAKDALKTGEGSAAGKDRARDAPPGKDKSPSATSLDDKGKSNGAISGKDDDGVTSPRVLSLSSKK